MKETIFVMIKEKEISVEEEGSNKGPLIFGKFFLLMIRGILSRSQRQPGLSTMLIPKMKFFFFENSFQNPSTVICHISADGQILKTDKYEYYQQLEDVITWNENNLVVLTKKTIHSHEIR
jgi:hypothetical protein